MNTRIQVEHPISEMITGIDLVQEQIKIAYGEKLSFTQDDIKFSGHAIECRINAENPKTFMPSPGVIKDYHPPGGLHVRVDSPIYMGYKIPSHYDSLVAKLIVYGKNRPECIRRLHRAIEEFVIGGIDTLLPLHKALSEDPDMQAGNYDIHWLEREFLKK
jgi:acetyl-CoA carboxylase biotin carboxylase subunit